MASKLIAIVAGVGPGTGASVARKFAKAYPVVLLARNPENFESLAKEINSSGGKALGISTDISDSGSVKNAVQTIRREFGPDVGAAVCFSVANVKLWVRFWPLKCLQAAIFNASGGFLRKSFLEVPEDVFSQSLDVSAKGGFFFSQAVLPLLLKGVEAVAIHGSKCKFTRAGFAVRF